MPERNKVIPFPSNEAATRPDVDEEVEDVFTKVLAWTDWTAAYNDLSRRNPSTSSDTTQMSTPTREEFEARLETVEARMDARVAKIEGKIDTLIAQMSERDRRQEERDKRIEMLAESAAKSAEHASTLKGHFWGAVVTIVLSVGGIAIASYFSTQSSNIMIAQTTLAAFQAGQANPPPPAKKP